MSQPINYDLAKDALQKLNTDDTISSAHGLLVGLGLSSVEASDEEVLEMIKDISEISQMDADLLDNEENTQDFYEIVEFVRIGVLFIQETLQPSKQDFISPTQLH